MKFEHLFFMLIPMLKFTALAGQSVLFRKSVGRCGLNMRLPGGDLSACKLKSTCLFSSVSVNDLSAVSENDKDLMERTKKAEKTFKGLTRMRLKKAAKISAIPGK